jgi:hypothetical protein
VRRSFAEKVSVGMKEVSLGLILGPARVLDCSGWIAVDFFSVEFIILAAGLQWRWPRFGLQWPNKRYKLRLDGREKPVPASTIPKSGSDRIAVVKPIIVRTAHLPR